jgi:outer membrane protein assembly factor BamB
MDQANSYSTPAKPSSSRRLRWAIVLVVLFVAAIATAKVVRRVMGYKPLPPTRIALRQPAAPTTNVSLTGAVEDWPRWRGPREDGISRETGIVSQLPPGGPPQVWSADVGIGYSSPVAVGGRLYLFTLVQGKETLTAFDAGSGQILWSDESAGPAWKTRYPGTRATPVVEGDAIYTYGGGGELTCRDLASGKPRWTVNILKTTGSEPLGWGQGSSPLLVGDLMYVQSGQGGAIAVAVKKGDGSVAWQSEARGVGGYAHPILADVSGQQQLVVFGGKAVFGMDPASGKTLWQQPWETNFDVNAATPVYRDGHVFVSSEYNKGCMMLRLTPGGAEKLWENKEVQSKVNGMILDGDHLYANSSGTIKCMSWPDGKIAWSAADSSLRLGAGGSIVRVGNDRLLAMSDRGKLTIARATPEKIEVLGQSQLLDGREVWATPLLYGGRLYAKGDTELVCFDLTGKSAPQTQAARAGEVTAN